MLPNNWPGLSLTLNKDNNTFLFNVNDHRETESVPINSASSEFIVSGINLFDNKFHNVVAAWSMSGNFFPNAIIDGTTSIKKGIVCCDNYSLPNILFLEYNGKSTPLSFNYNNSNSATFFSIGSMFSGTDSSTSLSFFTSNTNPFNGIIQEIVIWDTVLSSNSTDIGGFAKGKILLSNDPMSYANNIGINSSLYDPLTGSLLKSYSSNVIAYYKLNEENISSITAKDYSGTSNGGAQINTSSGNTLSLFGSKFLSGKYIIQDTTLNTNNIYSSGQLEFEDEVGFKQHIGQVYYDTGIIVLDNEYNNSGSGFPILTSLASSGMSFITSTSGNNFIIDNISFKSLENVERLTLSISAGQDQMNITENKTGVNINTGKQLNSDLTTFVSGIGLYNDFDELVAVAKLSTPLRKDSEHDIIANVILNF